MSVVNGSNVAANVLVHGLWYALEQSAELLCDAVTLYDQDRFPSAISLALLANEELGKSRNLLELWDEAENGKSVSAGDIRNAVRPKKAHQQKQIAALVSVTAGIAMGTEIGRLLYALGQNLMQIRSDRIAKCEQAEDLRDDLLADPRVSQLAEKMKTAREDVLYVNFDESHNSWLRPRTAFGIEVKELAWLLIMGVKDSSSEMPKKLLNGTYGPKLAEELNSWSARPTISLVPEPGPFWPKQTNSF